LGRYLLLALLLTALCGGTWFERAILFRGAADLWVVSDLISPADAAVVLGGGLHLRFVAADLYAKGPVHKILISQAEDGRTVRIGAAPGNTELTLNVLRKLGVPDGAIALFGDKSKNTMEEAVALRDWIERYPTSALIVPTEVFFAGRARWILHREFSGTAVRVEVPSYDPRSADTLEQNGGRLRTELSRFKRKYSSISIIARSTERTRRGSAVMTG
jgi:uncharacterized SAM-binding protein YcdF (DUF218 family)